MVNFAKDKIFIFDDELKDLESISNLLSSYFEIKGLNKSIDLLKAIQKDITDEYKLAVIDLIIEEDPFGGRRICREIKKVKPYLPVYAITKSLDPKHIADCLINAGFNGFVAKKDLEQNLASYVDCIRHVIAEVDKYPDIKLFWKDIVNLFSKEYQYAVKKHLRDKLSYLIRKAYFYLLLPESLPLLDSLILDENTGTGASIIESASAIEDILNDECQRWSKEIKDKIGVYPSRKVKLNLVIKQNLVASNFEEKVEELFNWRDHCAHGKAYKHNKEDAISSMRLALSFIKEYFKGKKQAVFPKGKSND